MVGGRREEGSFTINNSNVFAALDTLRKKKSKDKKSGTGSSKSKSSSTAKTKEQEPPVIWQPTPLRTTSWADVDDEDDDDYYATSAPLSSTWGVTASQPEKDLAPVAEESESEDDMLDLGDEEVEEDHEHETEAPVHLEPAVKKVPETPAPSKEPERQLSKKERKKKELEELDALLADMGVKNGNGEGAAQEKITEDQNKAKVINNGEEKDGVPTESKSAKKKKKKDKTSKEAKEGQDDPNSSEVAAEPTETLPTEEDASSIDVKERLKKLAAAKKKKSSKEMDGAAKAAAEAAARNARLASSKKKEKNHYNQQPIR